MKLNESARLKNIIELIRSSLQDYADKGFDKSLIPSIQQKVNQASQAAKDAEFPPAMIWVLDEVAKSVQNISTVSVEKSPAASLPMIRMILSSSDYIDYLTAGNADCPAAWLDLINDSRRQRGDTILASKSADPIDPFADNPSVPPQKKFSGDAEISSILKSIKPMLNKCIKSESENPSQASAVGSSKILFKSAEIIHPGPVRNLFWLVGLLMSSVANGSVPRTPGVKKSLIRASSCISLLSKNSPKSKSDASAAFAVRKVMELPFFSQDPDLFDATFHMRSGNREDEEEIRHVQDVLRGVSGKTIGDFRSALMDSLAAVFEREINDIEIMQSVVPDIRKASASLFIVGLKKEAKVVDDLLEEAANIPENIMDWSSRLDASIKKIFSDLDDKKRRHGSIRTFTQNQINQKQNVKPQNNEGGKKLNVDLYLPPININKESSELSIENSQSKTDNKDYFVENHVEDVSLNSNQLNINNSFAEQGLQNTNQTEYDSNQSEQKYQTEELSLEIIEDKKEFSLELIEMPSLDSSNDLSSIINHSHPEPVLENIENQEITKKETIKEKVVINLQNEDESIMWTPPAASIEVVETITHQEGQISADLKDNVQIKSESVKIINKENEINQSDIDQTKADLVIEDLLMALSTWSAVKSKENLFALRESAKKFVDKSKPILQNTEQAKPQEEQQKEWEPMRKTTQAPLQNQHSSIMSKLKGLIKKD